MSKKEAKIEEVVLPVPAAPQGLATCDNPGQGAWGAEGASSTDILIPKLHLMQSISEFVKKEQCKSGDIVNSVSGEVLVPRGKRIEIIPFLTYRNWEISRIKPGGKSEFLRSIPVDPNNDKLPSEDVDIDGTPISRSKVLNFFALLPTMLEELPFLIKFRKTGLQAGKVLSTSFRLCGQKNIPPASRVFSLGSELKTSDSGDYYAFSVNQSRSATQAELEVAYLWYTSLMAQTVKVAAEEEHNPF